MTINDNEILQKIIEIQACVIQGRSLKALIHRNIDFYLEKSDADIISIYINEHEELTIEYILEHHRLFAHLVKKFLSTKKKPQWKTFIQNCSSHFNAHASFYRMNNLNQLLQGLLNKKESEAFQQELQMKEAVVMPIYAFDLNEKIGYVCFIFTTPKSIDMEKLENTRRVFQTLLQPLYDTNHNAIYTKCARVDENMRMLTEQEKKIARKVLSGHPYPEIADMLGISINTLKTHMKHIFNKCNVSSKIELANKFNASL